MHVHQDTTNDDYDYKLFKKLEALVKEASEKIEKDKTRDSIDKVFNFCRRIK